MSLQLRKHALSTMSDAKSIVKNVVLLYIGEIISYTLAFLLVVAIARYLGDAGLGKYSFAISFVSIFLIFADMGLPTLITKEVAKDKNLTRLHLTKTFTLKLILNVTAFFITIAVIVVSRKDYETVLLVILAAIAMLFFNLGGVFRAIFQAHEVMQYEAFLKIVERIIAVGLGIFLIYRGYGLVALFLILIFSNIVYFFILYILVIMKVSKVSLAIDKKSWKQNLKEAMPFWVTLVFTTLYFKIDTIMLTFMKGFVATGLYNAALKIIEVITRVPFLLNVAVFPALSRFHRFSYDKVKLLYEKSFYYMIVLALPITTGLIMLADRIIIQVYSSEFKSSIITLQILTASLIFVFVNYLMGYLLNAIDKQKFFTLTVAITTCFNILLNAILIPIYSHVGAGIATLISEIINFCMLYYFTSKNNFNINLVRIIAKPMIANIALIVLIIFMRNFHLFFIISASAVAYFLLLFVINGIGKEEINLLKSLMQGK